MREDDLERSDVENALLKGKIDKRLTRTPVAPDTELKVRPTMVGSSKVVCRLDEEESLRIITIYALER